MCSGGRPLSGLPSPGGYSPLVIRSARRRTGPEAERILDELERVTGLPGKHVETGRSYNLTEAKDLMIAMASIRGQLDAISTIWPTHLGIELEAE